MRRRSSHSASGDDRDLVAVVGVGLEEHGADRAQVAEIIRDRSSSLESHGGGRVPARALRGHGTVGDDRQVPSHAIGFDGTSARQKILGAALRVTGRGRRRRRSGTRRDEDRDDDPRSREHARRRATKCALAADDLGVTATRDDAEPLGATFARRAIGTAAAVSQGKHRGRSDRNRCDEEPPKGPFAESRAESETHGECRQKTRHGLRRARHSPNRQRKAHAQRRRRQERRRREQRHAHDRGRRGAEQRSTPREKAAATNARAATEADDFGGVIVAKRVVRETMEAMRRAGQGIEPPRDGPRDAAHVRLPVKMTAVP